MLLFLPIPIIWAVKVSLPQRLSMMALLSSCIFIIMAAILRSAYALSFLDNLPEALKWAIRETFIGIITVSAPGIKPLFMRRMWKKQQYIMDSTQSKTNQFQSEGSKESLECSFV
jgi:hypothetical protein